MFIRVIIAVYMLTYYEFTFTFISTRIQLSFNLWEYGSSRGVYVESVSGKICSGVIGQGVVYVLVT